MDAKETLIRIVLPALLIYAALCLASSLQVSTGGSSLPQKPQGSCGSGTSPASSSLPGDRVYHFPSDSRAQKP